MPVRSASASSGPDRRDYLCARFSNRLFRINTDTGALTGVAWLITLPQQELDYSGNMTTSLTGDGNLLYYTVEIMEGRRKTGPTLYIIDPIKLS